MRVVLPGAPSVASGFRKVEWATNALDKVRREIWNQIRRSGHRANASELKGSRWVLLKNAQDLTPHQAAKLAVVAKLNAPLYRAYLLKEQLRMVFHVGYDEAIRSLERCRQQLGACEDHPIRRVLVQIRQIDGLLPTRSQLPSSV